jgi:NADH-quinone oxidoreductase subunit A
MQSASSQGVLFVLGMAFAAVSFILVIFGVNAVISPRNPNAEKSEPYECGMDQAGRPHGRTRLRFSTVALLFVLFDAEAALMFSVATRVHGSPAGLGAVAAFVALLGGGLAYAWRKGALAWPL